MPPCTNRMGVLVLILDGEVGAVAEAGGGELAGGVHESSSILPLGVGKKWRSIPAGAGGMGTLFGGEEKDRYLYVR